MRIDEIMTGPIDALVCGTTEQTFVQLAALMSRHNIGALPILAEDEVLQGVVSERDLVRAINLDGHEALTLKASAMMTRSVITCSPTDDMRTAQQLMIKHGVRHLPVTDEAGALVGMVSLRDLIRALSNQ